MAKDDHCISLVLPDLTHLPDYVHYVKPVGLSVLVFLIELIELPSALHKETQSL
jgi:hypothetical protein